jgi:hypothetical protein
LATKKKGVKNINTFEAWALLEFGLIVTVALISIWRGFVYVIDLISTQKLVIPEQKSVGTTWQMRFGEGGARFVEGVHGAGSWGVARTRAARVRYQRYHEQSQRKRIERIRARTARYESATHQSQARLLRNQEERARTLRRLKRF